MRVALAPSAAPRRFDRSSLTRSSKGLARQSPIARRATMRGHAVPRIAVTALRWSPNVSTRATHDRPGDGHEDRNGGGCDAHGLFCRRATRKGRNAATSQEPLPCGRHSTSSSNAGLQSISGPPAARSIGTVNGDDNARVTGTSIAAMKTMAAYRAHIQRERPVSRSTSQNTRATATSCQTNAGRVHRDAGTLCPTTARTLASTSTAPSANGLSAR